VDRAATRSFALLLAFLADGLLLHLHLAQGARTNPQPRADRGEVRVRLDPNVASEVELQLLRGIGPERARAIVERRRSRPFRGVGDLMAVPGIGPRTLAWIRDDVRVEAVDAGKDPRDAVERIESRSRPPPTRPLPPASPRPR
jgi:competence protein ComEA